MIQFFQSLSPYNLPPGVDPEDNLAVTRERILQLILLGSCVLGLLVIGSNVLVVINNQTYGLLVLYIALYIWLIAMTTQRKRFSYRVRSIGMLAIPLILGVTGLLQYGLAGNGRLFLLTFSIMAVSLLGVGAGSLAIFINIATLIFATVVRLNTNPLTAANALNNELGADWISAIFIFILLSAITTGALQIIVYSLQRAVARQKSLTEELDGERANLLIQVERRTDQLSNRTVQLEAANQISQVIARETNITKLCSDVVDRIVEQLNFYYASIFLLDARKEYAILQAGTGEAGKALLGRKHSLKVGEIGLVGFVVSRGEVKLAQSVRLDPVHYKNPLLPDTQSEIAIPLKIGDQVLGALDVQSTEEDAFTPDDIKTLQTIADQLATSLDRARLVERLQETLEQLDTGFRQFTESAWKSFLSSGADHKSYRFRKTEDQNLRDTLEIGVPLSPQAENVLRTGMSTRATQVQQHPGGEQLSALSPETNPEQSKVITALAIPILLRNQILGVIDVRFEGERISKEVLSLLETATTRLAIALENARLLEESQSRANREHLVGDISARVRGSTEVAGILQTAAMELGRVLGVSDVLVQLRSSANE